MSFGDRFLKIAKSYLNSATDSIEEEFSHLNKKWERGELSDEVLNRLKNLKDEVTKQGSDPSDLEDEEIERILRDSGYKNRSNDTENSNPGKARAKSPLHRKQSQLDQAYNRLGVKPSDSWDKIEKSYKKQLMKYHPDRFPGDEVKGKTATKLSQMISEAYQLIKTSRGE